MPCQASGTRAVTHLELQGTAGATARRPVSTAISSSRAASEKYRLLKVATSSYSKLGPFSARYLRRKARSSYRLQASGACRTQGTTAPCGWAARV
eukprot:6489701-Pyramimonas_sp.AAC.1